jgi:tRNA threonylcarbamoyladenosine biosynthesis protein TsaE
MIKDFVPARTSLTSGVVIKQHLLERNKYPQPLVEGEDITYSGSIKSQWLWSNRLSGSYVSSSLIETFSGGTGGTFSTYNVTGSILPNNTQSWLDPTKTPVGLINISQSDQKEFYNGELPYSEIVATNGELNEANTFKYPSTYEIYYNPVLYKSNATSETTFLNNNTSPKFGEIFLWWDSGSLTNPGKTTFIKDLCDVLGVTEATSSPSFSLVNEYETASGELIYHFDVYRLKNEGEAYDMGMDEYLHSQAWSFIEWAEKIPSLLPEHYSVINLTKLSDGNRKLVFSNL